MSSGVQSVAVSSRKKILSFRGLLYVPPPRFYEGLTLEGIGEGSQKKLGAQNRVSPF